MEKETLKSKINVIRLELSKEMGKSGKNSYSNYDYFQLKDFMPKAIELMNNNGVYAEFNMYKKKFYLPGKKTTQFTFDENGVQTGETVTEEDNFEYREVAFLDVYNLDDEEDRIHLERETANVTLSGAQPIQNLGGKSTYMKRYLYMDLFEINESDKVEEETGKPVSTETKTTKTAKPKTTTVETKPVEKESDLKDVETIPALDTENLMSQAQKAELAAYIKNKGASPKEVMKEITDDLKLDMKMLKASDYDSIKKEIIKKLGGESDVGTENN